MSDRRGPLDLEPYKALIRAKLPIIPGQAQRLVDEVELLRNVLCDLAIDLHGPEVAQRIAERESGLGVQQPEGSER